MRHSCSFGLAFLGVLLAATPPQAAAAVAGCDAPVTIERLPKISRNLFYFLAGNEAGDGKQSLQVVREGLAAVAAAATSETRAPRFCPEVRAALMRVQSALRCAQVVEPDPVYNRLTPIRSEALKDCGLPDPPRLDLTTVLEDARANDGDIRALSLDLIAPVAFTHDEIQATVDGIRQRVEYLAQWLAMAAIRAIDAIDGGDDDVVELHISFDAMLKVPTQFCLNRFTHGYDSDLDRLVDHVVRLARDPVQEYGRAKRRTVHIERGGANFDISNGLLRPAYEQQCTSGGTTNVDCGFLLPRAPSGGDGQDDAVGDSDAITISVSAGYGEQLNHAYTLAVPNTVFAARVELGPYNREASRPLCLPVYFAKGHHRTSDECAKAVRARLDDSEDRRDARLALLEAYAVADEEDSRNIGLVHLRTAQLREIAANVAVPRSGRLSEPLPIRNYTVQACSDCIERHVGGRSYFDVRRYCEAMHLSEDRSDNQTDLEKVQMCAYRMIGNELAPAPEGGPPSVALPPLSVLDAAGPGVVVETDRFGSYWEGVDKAIRQASVGRMDTIVKGVGTLVDEVGGQRENVISRWLAAARAFVSNLFASDQRTVRELESALESLQDNLATGSAAVTGREAKARLDFAQAWREHEWRMGRREALDSELLRLTGLVNELAELSNSLAPMEETTQDGGMSSERRERLEPIRAGLAAIANDIEVAVDEMESDTQLDLRRMAKSIGDALIRRRTDTTRARQSELRETARTTKDFAEATARWVAAVHELKLLQKVDTRVTKLGEEARALIASMSTDRGVKARRDAQADVCSTDSWPSRDTVGFISVFLRPTPDQISSKIQARDHHPGAYLLPLDVNAIEARPESWRDAMDDDARRLVTYFNSEFGHEEFRRVAKRGAIVVYIPLSASADLAAFRRDLWIALTALSTRSGAHVTLRDALESIGYVHHREDPADSNRGRFFVYSPRLVVSYAGEKSAKEIDQAVEDEELKSRLFTIASGDTGTAEWQAHPRWRDVVDWLIEDARLDTDADGTVTNLMDLQDLTKAPDVLVVRKPAVKQFEVSTAAESTPDGTCTCYDASGNFHDPRTQLTRLICENIVETGWPAWRFEELGASIDTVETSSSQQDKNRCDL